ncbi:hypothetical protein GCM10010978_09980 [Compostibacillus humi]|uniref:Uncharacterized protein n=1 Tax=Compostibacillus humi TaxID=1245525 RepID=A0A8J2ZRQ9_9BACI|nr:hypothetical protein [Compostibacillus humi]GGH72772.1 hypothetical protein GCM10010978_09980 [Compostibacillus humi]
MEENKPDKLNWWDGKVNGAAVKWFEGDAYVRLQDYEALLKELKAEKEAD